jgi:hypothetical protein
MTTRAVNQNNTAGAEPLIIDLEGSHGSCVDGCAGRLAKGRRCKSAAVKA